MRGGVKGITCRVDSSRGVNATNEEERLISQRRLEVEPDRRDSYTERHSMAWDERATLAADCDVSGVGAEASVCVETPDEKLERLSAAPVDKDKARRLDAQALHLGG